MSIIFVLLPLSLILGGVFLAAYLWSISTDQFKDLETPAVRLLADEDSREGE
jgi:cbb3-type cytochrome oxidase maturation protein